MSAGSTQSINGITSYFMNWTGKADSVAYQNAAACTTGVVFKLPGAVATAIYKGHNLGTPGAYSSNNQRKVGLSSSGIYCMVYSSGNRVWFTRYSTGPNTQELEISAGSSGSLNTYPSIVVNNNMANVVWQSIEWSGAPGFNYGYIHLRRYNIVNDTWGPIETIGSFVPTSQDFPASPVIAATSLGATESYDTKAVAWKDYAGITVRHCVYGWGQAGTVSGTDAYSNDPSIEMAPQNAVVILCWENSMSESIRYVEGSYNYATNVWSFTNASAVSPPDWASNQRPCLALGYSGTTYRVTVAWQGYGNVVEGGSTVNVRQASYPATIWDPGITSFSFMGTDVMYPAVGTFNGSNQLGIVWSFGGGIYRATYNGSTWTGPSLLASGSVGGNETNINTNSASMLQAVWRKPASGLTGTRWGVGQAKVSTNETASLSPFDFRDSTAHLVPYRLNRHGIVDLAQALDPEPDVSGMIAFEIAGANPQSAGSRSLNSAAFVANPGSRQGTFAGAIYGTNVAVPARLLTARKDALARVMLIDKASGGVLKEIWNVPFSALSDVRSGSFGTFREISVDLTGVVGKELAVAVEMLGGQKVIQPLIVDDYLVLSRPPAGDVAKPGTMPADELPGSYALHQNYPNPFNPSTTVSFDLPEAQTATLKVYSILGEELMTLAHGQFEPGRHTLLMDCSKLASGVYLYRIVAGSFSDTKRMLLIK